MQPEEPTTTAHPQGQTDVIPARTPINCEWVGVSVGELLVDISPPELFPQRTLGHMWMQHETLRCGIFLYRV